MCIAEPLEPRRLLATFTVTSPADSGPGTLRAAIVSANANPDADVIAFNLPDPAQAIAPTSALPAVTHPVAIDGATQPGFTGTPIVRITGAAAGPGVTGLRLIRRAVLREVAVINFSGDGVVLGGNLNSDEGLHFVQGCYIGIDPADPATPAGNFGDGIEINGSFCSVGVGTDVDRNVISGNRGNGIRIAQAAGGDLARNNAIRGNYIGLGPDGVAFAPNAQAGVRIETAQNTVGGPTNADGNYIAGNGASNVVVIGAAAAGNVIRRNTIGVNIDDRRAVSGASGWGVLINDAPDNTVGGDTNADGNLISGNWSGGVQVLGGNNSTGNRILRNRIGTDRFGTSAVGNTGHGVLVMAGNTTVAGNAVCASLNDGIRVEGASVRNVTVEGNRIGIGPNPLAEPRDLGNGGDGVAVHGADAVSVLRNTITGNTRYGVRVLGPTSVSTADDVVIRGNLIGQPFANDLDGVFLEAGSVRAVIGGADAADRNLISGNGASGVRINTTGASVLGNYIGTDPQGAGPRGNAFHGVVVAAGSNITPNVIGSAAAPNVISGNRLSGVSLQPGASYVTVEGNLIGTNAAGTSPVPNARHGVELLAIGGRVLNNVISGNIANGVHIAGIELGFNNTVQGNIIGTDRTGEVRLGNGAHGVWIGESARDNLIGGTQPGQGNRIYWSMLNGVTVADNARNNAILGNSLRSNQQYGIDLGNNGVTPNDPRDLDAGPNDLQNFPVITSATAEAGGVSARGTLDSTPNSRFRLEFFLTQVPDPSGAGEGGRFAGATTVTTDATGAATFDVNFQIDLGNDEVLTATSTRLSGPANVPGSTSEYSRNVPLQPRVADVFVAGSSWAQPFLNELAEDGLGHATYGFRVGPGQPGSIVLPWTNVDTIRFRFSRDVSVQQNDLAISSGARIPYAVTSFNYDPTTHTATWTLDRPLADYPRLRRTADVLLFVLDGTSPDGVFASNMILGPPSFLAGGDFTQRLYAVPGDANRNASVSPTDYGTVRSGVGRGTTDEGVSPNHYTVFKDVNANGNVSPTDVGIVRGNTGANVSDVPQPAANPHDAAVSSITSDLFATKSLLN